MSPPIRDGSGNSIGSVRLGDGTEIAEIRTGAGDVLFSAAPALPDSGLLHHYDATEVSGADGDSVDTVTDQKGSSDLTQSTSSKQPTLKTGIINNKQVVRFTASNSELLDTSYTESQELTRYVVFKIRSTGSKQQVVDGGSNDTHGPYETAAGNFAMFWGQKLAGSSADTNAHLAIINANGLSSEFRIDKSQVTSGDAGTNDPGGMTWGAKNNDAEHGDVDIGEVAEYDPATSGYSRSEIETYFDDKWGPF